MKYFSLLLLFFGLNVSMPVYVHGKDNGHCKADEEVIFNCPMQGKSARVLSICGSKAWGPDKGQVQYRFGKPGKVELAYPTTNIKPRDAFRGSLKTSNLRIKEEQHRSEDYTLSFFINKNEYKIYSSSKQISKKKYFGLSDDVQVTLSQGVEVQTPGKTIKLNCKTPDKLDLNAKIVKQFPPYVSYSGVCRDDEAMLYSCRSADNKSRGSLCKKRGSSRMNPVITATLLENGQLVARYPSQARGVKDDFRYREDEYMRGINYTFEARHDTGAVKLNHVENIGTNFAMRTEAGIKSIDHCYPDGLLDFTDDGIKKLFSP